MLAGMRHKTVLLLGLVLLVMATVACSLSPAETAYERGVDYGEQGDYEKAIEEYDEALRLNPEYANAYASRGGAYMLLGQYERAIQDFDEAIRLNPEYANAYYLRAFTYQSLGEQELADRDFQKAKELGYEP